MCGRCGYGVTSMRIPAPVLAEPTRVDRTVRARPGLLAGIVPKGRPSREELAGDRPPLDEYYNSLFTALGPQHWWPARTQFEVIVGAILTQNTSWTNVERAISRLRESHLLSPGPLGSVPLRRLERLIRSSGYFRQKARKLKAFCEFLDTHYGGSLKRMFETPTIVLREKLLGVFGIGPETADSILLYAGDHSVFVVDAYTKRMLLRHGWAGENAKYEDIRRMFEREFPGDVKRFNELHALIVNTGKNYCRTRDPLCHECPLGRYLEEGR
jgi:endonuclease III related protein